VADFYNEDSGLSSRSKRARYEALRSALWTERSTFDSHWKELGDYLLPRRTRFWVTDRNKGDKRNRNIIDSTGRYAARTLASGLHAGLTSPARPWMKLTTPDPELAEFGPVKEWLHIVTNRMLTIFLQSNLYNALPTVYGDMGVFGTGAMAILEDSRDLFRAYAYPIGSYAIGLDERLLVTAFIREYELTVRQVVKQFGVIDGTRQIDWSKISSRTKALWDAGQYESSVEVCWFVMPNEDADATRFEAKFLPWKSCYLEKGMNEGDNTFLRESGFRTFPILCPRWDVTGEDAYGTDCPGMTTLGDVKQLQIMQRRKGQAIAKQIDPPVMGPTSLKTQKTSLLPGDITYVDVREGQAGLKSIHDVNVNLADLTADIGETQYRIRRGFYEDLFLMLAVSDPTRGSQPITAREVEERHEEKLLALGPVLERTNDELLDPLVDRVWSLMEANELIPPAPAELENVTLKVEYISILAQAQKLVGIIGQDRFMQTSLPLVQIYPEVRHKIAIMRVIDNYADMLGVDPRIVRPTKEAEALVAQDQQAAAEAARTEQMATMAAAAKDAAQAPIGGASDTVLTRAVEGGGI
jgi:hypothetical protein